MTVSIAVTMAHVAVAVGHVVVHVTVSPAP